MTKYLVTTITIPMPDDEFERAGVIGTLKPKFDQIMGGLAEHTDGQARISHAIQTPRDGAEPRAARRAAAPPPAPPPDKSHHAP